MYAFPGMNFVWEFTGAYPFVGLLLGGFTIWMLIDAYRRQAEIYWFLIILLLQPVGSIVYFFVVLLPELRLVRNVNFAALFQRRASLEELTYRAEQTPTLTNHLLLAQRLLELHRPAEAVPHLQAALKTEPDHASCLFALAQCRQALGEHDAASALLDKLLARDPRWSNYTAWRLLIVVKTEAGDAAGPWQPVANWCGCRRRWKTSACWRSTSSAWSSPARPAPCWSVRCATMTSLRPPSAAVTASGRHKRAACSTACRPGDESQLMSDESGANDARESPELAGTLSLAVTATPERVGKSREMALYKSFVSTRLRRRSTICQLQVSAPQPPGVPGFSRPFDENGA